MIKLSGNRRAARSGLDDIINEPDELGLLDVAPLKAGAVPYDLTESKISEVARFIQQYHRPPDQSDKATMEEKRLAHRWHSVQENSQARAKLQAMMGDNERAAVPASLDDIIAADDSGLLDFDEPDIFCLQHVRLKKEAPVKKEQPDEIAQRSPCADFARFEPLFHALHQGLADKTFTLKRFTHRQKIREGDFFVFLGLLGYVAGAGNRLEQYDKYNARLHLIFENATECRMLYRSLVNNLARDEQGRKVNLQGKRLRPASPSVAGGFVYVLATLSNSPDILPYKDALYKIGFTHSRVEDRIENAEKDLTFLEAPARVVYRYQCFNFNPQKLEKLVHGFLAPRRLNITIKRANGETYIPREWFNVPLNSVVETINYIMSGDIAKYRLDSTSGEVVKK